MFVPSSAETKHTFHSMSEQLEFLKKKHYVTVRRKEISSNNTSRFRTVVLVKIQVFWDRASCPMCLAMSCLRDRDFSEAHGLYTNTKTLSKTREASID
jgi:hypothetical protein